MKKTILIIVAIIAMINISKAQDNGADGREILQMGAKIGTNYSNVYDVQGQDFVADPKFGLVFGGFIAIPIGKYIGVQPELLYSQKGFKATGKLLGYTYEYKRTTSYVDIPILFQLKPSQFLTIVAGPQYSYLVSQKNEFTSTIYSNEQEQQFNNDNVRKNILCFIGGVDVNVNHFVLGVRAGWDLTQNNGDGTSTTPRYKNVWYQFTLGYSIF
ncbi:MAG: porin family protein [Bacteroidota bacterium]